MELMEKQGYKQTDVGLIPEDWIVLAQKDAVKYINGRAYSISEWEATGIPVVRLQNLTQKGGNFYYSNLNLPEHQYMYKGDLIFMWSASFGPYIWWGDKAIYHYHIWKIECNEKITDKIFYYHKLVQLTEELKKGTSGSTMLHLTKEGMEKYFFALPPTLEEQKAIATALSDVDDLISNLDKLITKKKAIKQGAMQQLLTPPHKGGKRLAGFTGEWVEKRLEKVGEIITGGTPSTFNKLYWDGSIPWVTPTDIGNNKNIVGCERYLTNEGLKVIRKLPKDSLLVTCIASIGKNAILRKNGACNQQINAIIPNELNNVDFLYYLIEINSNVIKSKAGITATLMVSKKVFSEISFDFPPTLEEQKAIAEILSDMDNEIEQLETKKAKYQDMKQGMMQELLTGKTRLV